MCAIESTHHFIQQATNYKVHLALKCQENSQCYNNIMLYKRFKYISIIFIINFEFGYGIIQNERIDLYTIPKDKREQLLSPTRTAIATELVFSGPAFSYPDGRDGSDVIYSLFFNGIRDQDSFHGIQTIKDFILTLEKNTNNEIDRDLSKLSVEQIDKSWNLS
jgi:hypothetical protein